MLATSKINVPALLNATWTVNSLCVRFIENYTVEIFFKNLDPPELKTIEKEATSFVFDCLTLRDAENMAMSVIYRVKGQGFHLMGTIQSRKFLVNLIGIL